MIINNDFVSLKKIRISLDFIQIGNGIGIIKTNNSGSYLLAIVIYIGMSMSIFEQIFGWFCIQRYLFNFGREFECPQQFERWQKQYICYFVREIFCAIKLAIYTFSLYFIIPESEAISSIPGKIIYLVFVIQTIITDLFFLVCYIYEKIHQKEANDEFPLLDINKGEKKNEECGICLMISDQEWGTLPCEHQFHYECLKQWTRVNTTCPLCRKKYYTVDYKNLLLQSRT